MGVRRIRQRPLARGKSGVVNGHRPGMDFPGRCVWREGGYSPSVICSREAVWTEPVLSLPRVQTTVV
jgi:hypothetical protein